MVKQNGILLQSQSFIAGDEDCLDDIVVQQFLREVCDKLAQRTGDSLASGRLMDVEFIKQIFTWEYFVKLKFIVIRPEPEVVHLLDHVFTVLLFQPFRQANPRQLAIERCQ